MAALPHIENGAPSGNVPKSAWPQVLRRFRMDGAVSVGWWNRWAPKDWFESFFGVVADTLDSLLVETSATLVVTGALLVVTRS